MASKNHKLHGVPIPREKGQFWGKGSPIAKYRIFCRALCKSVKKRRRY